MIQPAIDDRIKILEETQRQKMSADKKLHIEIVRQMLALATSGFGLVSSACSFCSSITLKTAKKTGKQGLITKQLRRIFACLPAEVLHCRTKAGFLLSYRKHRLLKFSW